MNTVVTSKEEILKTSRELIQQHGWSAVNIRSVAAACGGAVWLQGMLFVAVSVVALLATKPLVKKYLRPRMQATNADRCVGRTGVVLEDIDNLAATGQVRVCGSVWSARSTDGAPIAAGTTVVVDRIEGVKLMVRPAKAPVGKV